jgi:phospholipase/lecithinase/hemolysin
MWIKKLSVATAGVVFVLGTILGFSSGAAAQNFNEIYVFGDSLSDVGNVSETTKGDIPPSPPYFRGRYSNGPVWVEYLATKLKLTSNPDTNFAFGGATTGDSLGIPPGLLVQIESFMTTNSSTNPNALYIIWAGANDYLGGATDSTAPVNNLVMAVKSLSAVGAKNIVVVNLPDLGKLPGTRTSQSSNSLNNLTQKHNSELAAALNNLRLKLSSDINITYLDVNSLFNQVINTPAKFGFTNVTKPCISNVSICDNPNDYLFWDDIHPTTATHKLFVELAFSALKPASEAPHVSVPEITGAVGVFVFGVLSAALILKGKKAIKNRF